MSKKKKHKADDLSPLLEDTEVEATEGDDEGNDTLTAPKQDEMFGVDGACPEGLPLEGEDSDLGKPADAPAVEGAATDAATDGGSEGEKKPDDATSAEAPEASSEGAPAEPATSSTDEPGIGEAPAETKQGAVVDTADLSVKEPDGTVIDDTNTSVMPEEPAKEDEASEDQPAVGSAEYLEQQAKEAEAAPAPVDPATLPGMAPVETIGSFEAAGGMAPPVTAIDGVSKGEDVPALGEVHEAAKPIEEALDGATLDGLKAAGDQASDALHRLKDAELELAKLPDDAREIAAHVKAMGLHFVAALEALFKRQ